MDKLTPQNLVDHLKRHCPDVEQDSWDAILRGKVSGKRAAKYTSTEWTELGIPYGDAVDIVGAIHEFCQTSEASNEGNKENLCSFRAPQRLQPQLVQTQYSVTGLGANVGVQVASTSNCSSQDESSMKFFSTDEDTEPADKYEVLKPYFDSKTFSEMGDYLKQSYLNRKENYEKSLTMGVTMAMPFFMKLTDPKPVKNQQRNAATPLAQRCERTTRSKGLQLAKTSCSENVPNTSAVPPVLSEISNAGLFSANQQASLEVFHNPASPNNTLRQNSSDHSDLDEEDDCVSVETSNKSQSKHALDTSDSSNVSANPSSSAEPRSNVKRPKRRKRTSELLTEEEYYNKLPKYDIDAILEGEGDPLKKVRKALQKDAILFGADRKLMMRTLTKHLYYDNQGKIRTVSTDMKSGMAASIVAAYPLFKDDTVPTKRSWWRIFDPTGPSGYIANCTTSIFRKLKPDERLRGGGQSLTDVADEETPAGTSSAGTSGSSDFLDPDASWMSLTMPYGNQKAGLLKGMEKSFCIRREWISKKGPSITEILSKYPHLMSYGSEMLEKEFGMMFPDKGSMFLKSFPDLIAGLKSNNQLAENEFEPEETSDALAACLCIANKLPRPNLQRRTPNESVMPKLEALILSVPIGVNVKDVVAKKRGDARHPVQPYILALVPAKHIVRLFVVADSEIIDLKTVSILQALDLLFKTYMVFNVHYPLGWKNFWELVEHGVFKITPERLTNSARELLIKYGLIQLTV